MPAYRYTEQRAALWRHHSYRPALFFLLFFFAFYPSDLAAINMYRIGTTHIGKYLLNHSFMIPGFIGVGTSTVVAYLISRVIF